MRATDACAARHGTVAVLLQHPHGTALFLTVRHPRGNGDGTGRALTANGNGFVWCVLILYITSVLIHCFLLHYRYRTKVSVTVHDARHPFGCVGL
jgi:hypothetical protein